jgi:hypothetical protein
MATITLTNEQLRLVQEALEFYMRFGILQVDCLLEHPTVRNILHDRFRPKKALAVGDETPRGVVVEIADDYIKTKGVWSGVEEIKTWHDVENVKHTPDYFGLEIAEDLSQMALRHLVRCIAPSEDLSMYSHLGIYNKKVDESCRVAYDIMQVIRHEFWKKDDERTNMVVSSSVFLSTKDSDQIKVEIND